MKPEQKGVENAEWEFIVTVCEQGGCGKSRTSLYGREIITLRSVFSVPAVLILVVAAVGRGHARAWGEMLDLEVLHAHRLLWVRCAWRIKTTSIGFSSLCPYWPPQAGEAADRLHTFPMPPACVRSNRMRVYAEVRWRLIVMPVILGTHTCETPVSGTI
jgi:hypothetical protein